MKRLFSAIACVTLSGLLYAQTVPPSVVGGAGITGTGAPVRATSPTLVGTPAAPTQPAGDQTTAIATDAFVATAIANATAGSKASFGPAGFPAVRPTLGPLQVNDTNSLLLPACSALRKTNCKTRTF